MGVSDIAHSTRKMHLRTLSSQIHQMWGNRDSLRISMFSLQFAMPYFKIFQHGFMTESILNQDAWHSFTFSPSHGVPPKHLTCINRGTFKTPQIPCLPQHLHRTRMATSCWWRSATASPAPAPRGGGPLRCGGRTAKSSAGATGCLVPRQVGRDSEKETVGSEDN